MSEGLKVRDTARALVLDPENRVLLVAYEAARDVDPLRPGLRRFWFTPGGGLEPGETHEEALARELEEEIGVSGLMPQAYVARREAPFLLFRQPRFVRERHYLVRLPSPAIDTSRLAETEDNPVHEVRWWTAEALRETTEVVEPRGFSDLALRIIDGEVPRVPAVLA